MVPFTFFASGNARRKVLDVSGGSSSNGANVQIYDSNMSRAQLWKIHEDQNGFLTFECSGSGLALDVSGGKAESGRNVQQYRSNGTIAQKWIAVKDEDGTLVLHSAIDFDYVLEIAGGSSVNGANVQLYKANGTAAQSFSAYDSVVIRSHPNDPLKMAYIILKLPVLSLMFPVRLRIREQVFSFIK